MALGTLFRPRRHDGPAHGLYLAAVVQARLPEFYLRCGVADTVDGRFDLLTLHVCLIVMRLAREGPAQKPLSQALFDLMFADMDVNLRELGVSDTGVGSRVKSMARAFYGRLAAYGEGLADDTRLGPALERNLYRGRDGVGQPVIAAMADYVRRQDRLLAGQAIDALAEGRVAFDPPPAP
ncbi:MAG TPA: hypothetical protein HPQ04_03705 [Rhodospirillaceae bacterium]|nr:hypothetical protein [Rhodospirillaceae bacterium]